MRREPRNFFDATLLRWYIVLTMHAKASKPFKAKSTTHSHVSSRCTQQLHWPSADTLYACCCSQVQLTRAASEEYDTEYVIQYAIDTQYGSVRACPQLPHSPPTPPTHPSPLPHPRTAAAGASVRRSRRARKADVAMPHHRCTAAAQSRARLVAQRLAARL